MHTSRRRLLSEAAKAMRRRQYRAAAKLRSELKALKAQTDRACAHQTLMWLATVALQH